MLRVNQLKIPVNVDDSKIDELLRKKAAAKIGVSPESITSLNIFKRSIDARHDIQYVYTLDIELKNENKVRINKDVSFIDAKKYSFEYTATPDSDRPVIIGMGPAGLFCGLMLAQAGFKPILLERGKDIIARTADVEEFWNNGRLLRDSNVQFGEGGAGAFSDGKLNTVVKDKSGKNRKVLEIFVDHGACSDILYDNKPHIGTDVLVEVVRSIREEIISLGGEVRFNSQVTDFFIENNQVKAIKIGDEMLECSNVVLAIGHSARDTFEVLFNRNINMEPKPFAVGFRVSHPQRIIDAEMYGDNYEDYGLPAAPYKVTYNAEDKRGVYSFCMCPGGYVVNASSEEGMLAVNGMSYHDRGSGVANSAIVVSVTPEDYGGSGPLRGMHFQRELERKAYELGKGKIPVQKYGDFKSKINTKLEHHVLYEAAEAFKGDFTYCDLTGILDPKLNTDIVMGMEHFGKIIRGFNDDNALLAGIESRTSSPVRISRSPEGQSEVKGLFPCGEGAGYAGGITSAAIDGIFIAECVAKNILNSEK